MTEFTLPTVEQAIELEKLSEEDEPSAYLQSAVKDWLPNFSFNVLDAEGRIQLGYELMHHSFMQSVINLTGGTYYQVSKIAEDLAVHYPDLKTLPDADVVINSLFALISHARTGKVGKLRPFLNVQVQLWMRELRRLVAKVDSDEITYEIAHDLNKQQAKQYLPVVNCRDCGITGWVSVLNERSNATMTNIESFYNLYFRADEKIVMMFPHSHDERVSGMIPARICPDCLQVKLGEDGTDECVNCGAEMVDVMIPSPIKTSGTKNHKQYVCPCCGSRRGLSLMGLRSATEISASISQMFASKFNDDKKTLAFSDNVQDAAHRAGFFNSRTWRFGLRTAIQKYCTEIGSGKNLADFQNGFIKYWHEHMTDEQFVSFFIAPNLTFIVGDSHQRIYRNYPTLSKCGINVRGRSSILKINYRTTEEIRKHAFALLNGISFDDLDEDLDLGDKCQSLTHGEKPIVENFENANDEFDFLLREVKKLKENGVSLTDICVVARTKKLVDDYIALFTRAGIRSYAIKRNKVDDRSFDGLRVATMHRVKGLEFKYVFIAAVNNRIIPLPFAINKTDAVSEVESITSEKCLLYVAMTRAQKGVYITSYGRPSEFLV